VDSAAASSAFDAVDPVDVALLKARYIAAFEHYLAQAAKLAEQSDNGGAALVPQLEEERRALEDFAAVRSSLLIVLAMRQPQIGPSLVAETRDEVIRRSIAKRDQGSLDTPVRRRRLNQPRRTA
jgi:hypothetical protein